MSTTKGNIFTRGLSRMSGRKKKTKSIQNSLVSQQQLSFDASVVPMPMPNEKSTIFSKGMDRLRRSLRLPKKRRDRSHDRHLSPDVTGSSKTEQWQPDESAVRGGTCCFNVKYLGAVEVYESRGMTVCEGALKSLKAARRKPVKAVLYVSGDGLRVVDQGNSRGLLVDQTIEKVSFCAPDRQTDKGFAYICRDGASRRWMCHGFLATKETGERLSHAVGCAFSICLEKKKKRDEEAGTNTTTHQEFSSTTPKVVSSDVFHPNWGDTGGIEGPSSSAAFDVTSSATTASRSNLAYQSFRKHVSIEDRYLDPQSVIINEVPASNHMDEIKRISKPRPSGNPALFQRQGSLRAPEMPSTSDHFKRNLSLRTGTGSGMINEKSAEKKSFGTQLYNEPIYEGDEDPLGLGIVSTPNPTSLHAVTSHASAQPTVLSKNGLDGLDLNFQGVSAPIVEHHTNGDFVCDWPQNKLENPVLGTLDKLQKQFEDVKLISMSSGESTPTARSKADEWLDDILRVSMSMSPTSPTSSSSGIPSYSTLPKSGPPPAHAPPPLPVRQAVSNGSPSLYQQQISARNSPAGINWSSSPNHIQVTQIPAKPVDPFDVQWSRLAVNNTN